MEEDSPKENGDTATRANPLLKSMTTATLVLYAMGWGSVLGWQNGWEPSMRASYGYQLGWVTCLATCGCVLLLRRGHLVRARAELESNAAATSASKGGV